MQTHKNVMKQLAVASAVLAAAIAATPALAAGGKSPNPGNTTRDDSRVMPGDTTRVLQRGDTTRRMERRDTTRMRGDTTRRGRDTLMRDTTAPAPMTPGSPTGGGAPESPPTRP